MVATERGCKRCGGPMTGLRLTRTFCSGRCRALFEEAAKQEGTYYRGMFTQLLPDEDPSPDVWDGKTKHSDPPGYERYAAVCLACGARTDVTAKQAELLSRCSARCSTCRGNVLVERDDIGSVGSPRLVSSELYETMKAVWRSGATA